MVGASPKESGNDTKLDGGRSSAFAAIKKHTGIAKPQATKQKRYQGYDLLNTKGETSMLVSALLSYRV